MKYQVELIWNREFHFVPYGPLHENLKSAIKYAEALKDMGDGKRVKETRIVDSNHHIFTT